MMDNPKILVPEAEVKPDAVAGLEARIAASLTDFNALLKQRSHLHTKEFLQLEEQNRICAQDVVRLTKENRANEELWNFQSQFYTTTITACAKDVGKLEVQNRAYREEITRLKEENCEYSEHLTRLKAQNRTYAVWYGEITRRLDEKTRIYAEDVARLKEQNRIHANDLKRLRSRRPSPPLETRCVRSQASQLKRTRRDPDDNDEAQPGRTLKRARASAAALLDTDTNTDKHEQIDRGDGRHVAPSKASKPRKLCQRSRR